MPSVSGSPKDQNAEVGGSHFPLTVLHHPQIMHEQLFEKMQLEEARVSIFPPMLAIVW